MGLREPGNFAEAFLCRLVQRPKVDSCSKVGGHQVPMVPGDELQPDQGREIGADLVGGQAMCDDRFRGALAAAGVGQGGGDQVREQLPL
ncbi:hypothetical protein OG949_17345 [Streptomyces scopuliridis]|uniref:hypothetical protein n=1 Tax=Streptomyces scopuliridis TaxID=452529 RepID=UPI002DDA2C0F|nr:hypothetical protein [Streptomyces scopuliridis]WSB34465.1 hypothetical protein OG949_17345 [Streptomyces scopuliridis]